MEIVRTRLYIVATLTGPLLLMALILIPSLMSDDEGGTSNLVIADESGVGIGAGVKGLIASENLPEGMRGTTFHVELLELEPGALEQRRGQIEGRVEAGELDGYLWIPQGITSGDTARYQGTDATSIGRIRTIDFAVERTVQNYRLSEAGIEPATVSDIFLSVPFQARKTGTGAVTGSPLPALFLGILITLGGWFTIINSSNSVIRGVREEKQDKVVEIVLSSISPKTLLFGKIIGIWGASMLQALVWVAMAGIGLSTGEGLITQFGGNPEWIPEVPASVGVVVIVFFAGGYFLYAAIAAALTSISLNDQEASQIPTLIQWLPMPAWLLIFKILNDPDGTYAVIGTMIPLFAPLVVPTRIALTDIPWYELLAAVVLLYGSGWLFTMVAAKLYRINIMAAGTRVSPHLVFQWLRSG
jgi:ABC-2 type transport system permease protein